jgi:hypothetical protein
MSDIDKLPTWTDGQLQSQLEMWETSIDNDKLPQVELTIASNPNRLSTESSLYMLEFDEQTIKLTFEQAQFVHKWLGDRYKQLQLYRIRHAAKDAIKPAVISTENPNLRDTQFAGFAKALYEELACNVVKSPHGLSDGETFKQEQYLIIARRAYDLVEHTLNTINSPDYQYGEASKEEMEMPATAIPDLSELPKE